MKSKFFTLFAAFVLLFSAQASAQVNGDVNDDGKVNEQDIAAILEIMAEAGGVKEQTKYYWYVGQTNPATMTSISPIVTDNTSPGWREIGTVIPEYSKSNMLWNQDKGIIETGPTLKKQYVAIPAASPACPRDGLGNDASTVNIYTRMGNITIEGIEYKIYVTVTMARKYGTDTY